MRGCDYHCASGYATASPETSGERGGKFEKNVTISQGHLVAIEINPTHAGILRRRFPGCEVVEDSAEKLPQSLGGRQASCVVSGLPWASMPGLLQDRILRAVLESSRPDGQFIAFAYAHARWFPSAKRFHARLRESFKRVETSPIVWWNLPPAYVYRCWRA